MLGFAMFHALLPGSAGKQRPFKEFMATANDIRRGMAINYNGDIAVVLDTQHRTPGNLRAFVQASIRSIRTGKSSDVRFSSTEKVEVVPMTTVKMDFSYKDGNDFVFSDPETYETVTLSAELVGDAKNYLVENAHVTVTFVEDKAVSIELPARVVLTVTDAPANTWNGPDWPSAVPRFESQARRQAGSSYSVGSSGGRKRYFLTRSSVA